MRFFPLVPVLAIGCLTGEQVRESQGVDVRGEIPAGLDTSDVMEDFLASGAQFGVVVDPTTGEVATLQNLDRTVTTSSDFAQIADAVCLDCGGPNAGCTGPAGLQRQVQVSLQRNSGAGPVDVAYSATTNWSPIGQNCNGSACPEPNVDASGGPAPLDVTLFGAMSTCSAFRVFFDTAFPLPISGTTTLVGTGTAALLGNDLTDPENDGSENPLPFGSNWNWISIQADDEPFFQGGEGAYNVFDNTLGSGNAKWCCTDATPSDPRWIAVEFANPIELTHFTISSANDVPTRDPNWWHIEGSNDGVNWEPIFVQDAPAAIWTARLQVARVDLDTPAPPFTWFRYIAFETPGTNHQLGELEFFGNTL